MNIDLSTCRQRVGCFDRCSYKRFKKTFTFKSSSMVSVSSLSLSILACLGLGILAIGFTVLPHFLVQQSSSLSGLQNCDILKSALNNLGYAVDYNFLAKYKYGNRDKKGLKIMHWNAGGGYLHYKLPEIEAVIEKYKPHIFGISETCFRKKHNLDDIKIDNYEVYLSNTLQNRNLNVSRVAVYVHRDVVKQKLRQDLMTENFSSVWLEVGLKGNKSILVGNIYRDWQYLYQADNTSLAVEEQLSRFSGFIEKWEAAIELSDECHLLGDMNLNFLEYSKVDILPNSQSYKLRSLIKLLFERILPLGAVQCVTSATRVSPNHEASGLDHYYTTNPQKLSSVATITNGSSDHKIICATRFSKAIVAHERVTKKRSYKYFNPEAFKLAVRKISWWEIYSSNDVNEAVQKLSDNLTKILDTMAPIKIFQNRTKYAPWLSASTKNWMKLRDQALEKALDTKNLGDFALYRKLRNKIVSILKTEKQAWY